jgi:hypothetical protein
LVESPEVECSAASLRPGDDFDATITTPFRRKAKVKRVLAEIVFQEVARYTRGTDTYHATYNHVSLTREYPGGPVAAGQRLIYQFRGHIPPDAMHTFRASNNTLRWGMRLTLEFEGVKTRFVEFYGIEVRPEPPQSPHA